MLLISARRMVMLYICAKFHEIILNGIKVIERTVSIWKITKGDYSAKTVGGRTVFISAHCLVMLYISTKFCEIISNGIKVIERTQYL